MVLVVLADTSPGTPNSSPPGSYASDAFAVYRLEQAREIPGVTFEMIVAFPILWVRRFEELAFREEPRASQPHYKNVRKLFPQLLEE